MMSPGRKQTKVAQVRERIALATPPNLLLASELTRTQIGEIGENSVTSKVEQFRGNFVNGVILLTHVQLRIALEYWKDKRKRHKDGVIKKNKRKRRHAQKQWTANRNWDN